MIFVLNYESAEIYLCCGALQDRTISTLTFLGRIYINF